MVEKSLYAYSSATTVAHLIGKKSILFLILTLIVTAPLIAGAEIVLDQTQESNVIGGRLAGGVFGRAAQTFTAGISGMLSQVDLDLLWIDPLGAGNTTPRDLTVRILGTTPSGQPDDAAVLGSGVVPGSALDLNVPTWVTVDLSPSAIVVSAGDVLAIELNGPDPVSWRLGSGYPGGIFFQNSGAGWVDNVTLNPGFADLDHTFRTYVDDSGPSAILDQFQESNAVGGAPVGGIFGRKA